MVVFEKCENSEVLKCKDDAIINEWMRGKYIITLTNTKHFIQNKFKEESIYNHSEIKWFPLTDTLRSDQVIQY